jgi:phosphate transport system protein
MALDKLKRNLLAMGEMCEHALMSALMGLMDRDSELACYVIEYDPEIDEMELSIDRDCTTLIGEGQLAGEELRLVISAVKINNDLERIGDLAVNIAEHVLFLVREKSVLAQVIDFQYMLEQASSMTRESIQALITQDPDLAWKIIDERQIVEDEMQIIFRQLLDIMRRDPRTIERGLHIFNIAKSLTRVAYQASNVAEEVIFTVEGVVVRHHLREFHPVSPHLFGDMPEAEMEKAETSIIRNHKSREQAQAEHDHVKRTSQRITRGELAAKAAAAEKKAAKSRERLELIRKAARK